MTSCRCCYWSRAHTWRNSGLLINTEPVAGTGVEAALTPDLCLTCLSHPPSDSPSLFECSSQTSNSVVLKVTTNGKLKRFITSSRTPLSRLILPGLSLLSKASWSQRHSPGTSSVLLILPFEPAYHLSSPHPCGRVAGVPEWVPTISGLKLQGCHLPGLYPAVAMFFTQVLCLMPGCPYPNSVCNSLSPGGVKGTLTELAHVS